MDDEFALCWNNFQENIASGFQNLFDRGDLVDVTLACDGKLLQAHKIVLAICSPYFQEMFITNPCRHPIIVLKDVSSTVMTELLQFMYQGVVNVKHTELNSFMKIAQALQIKGLATSSTSNQQLHHHQSHHHTQKSPASPMSNIATSSKNPLDAYGNAAALFHSSPLIGQKRAALDYAIGHNSGEPSVPAAKKHLKRSSDSVDNDISTESMENMSSDDGFPIPQISMIESGRFDLSNVKRETSEPLSSPGSTRNLQSSFNFEYNRSANNANSTTGGGAGGSSSSSSNAANANHMDIPTGGNITMLSSTSLLHGNCIFNRNNTVATQQGMKTYWLCKSYRITMCRARCITHQGRVISATGMHNHQPHMKGSYPNCEYSAQSGNGTVSQNAINNMSVSMRLPSIPAPPPPASSSATTNISQSTSPHNNMLTSSSSAQHSAAPQSESQSNNSQMHPPNDSQDTHSAQSESAANAHHSPSTQNHHHLHHQPNASPNNALSLQNMMQSVLSQNNLIHLSNITPILNPMQHHPHLAQMNSSHPSTPLHILGGDHLHSPSSPRSASALHHQQTVHNHPQHNHGQHHPAHHSQQSHSHQTDSIHQHNHYHHHRESQQNDNNSSVVASSDNSSPMSPSNQQQAPSHSLSPNSASAVHHSLTPEMSNLAASSSFKMEQM